ncbi:MAG: hypothetical protein R3C59_05825 [Planctomycetaceae bacterium]
MTTANFLLIVHAVDVICQPRTSNSTHPVLSLVFVIAALVGCYAGFDEKVTERYVGWYLWISSFLFMSVACIIPLHFTQPGDRNKK